MRLYFTFFAICKTPIMHLACPPPPPPPQNLRKHCLQFLLGRLKYHGDMKKNKGYAKYWGANKGYYRRCAEGESSPLSMYSRDYQPLYRVFSHEATADISVFQTNEKAAMLVFQTNPVGVELFSFVNAFSCFNKFA